MKKLLLIAFLSLITNFSSISYASECHLNSCPDDIFSLLFRYLTLPELYNMGLTAKRIDSSVMEYISNNDKEDFSNAAKNHVMLKNYEENPFTTIDDLLNGERQPLKRVYGVTDLLRKDPEKFIKLVLHSIPHTPETIESELRTFHQETFQINKLISSLPTYETAQQKLAGVLIELLTWGQVGDQVWDQVKEDLRHFQIASAYQAGNLNEVLKPAIDYTFTVYQLGTLAMRHSDDFKKIHTDFSEFFAEKITEEQAGEILKGLNIPNAPEGSYLIDTQLQLIRRLKPDA